MIYLYTEDSGSGYEFWNFICKSLFSDKIKVKNFGEGSNSSRLAEFVCNIKDREHIYFIAYDMSFDNVSVMMEYKQMKNYVKENEFKNIFFLDFISFEFVLLSFSKFVEWCFSKDDFLKEKREKLLICRKELLELGNELSDYADIKYLKEFILEHNINNIEQCCSKLLFYIVRNTGFAVDKRSLGECWYVDCCTYSQKELDDECGVDGLKLTGIDKAFEIYTYSCMKKKFDELDVIISDLERICILDK